MIPTCDVCGTDVGVVLANAGTRDQTHRCAEHMPEPSFEYELSALVNHHSQENESNTPDFILARYLRDCLDTFNRASRARERWYGQEHSPGQAPATPQPQGANDG